MYVSVEYTPPREERGGKYRVGGWRRKEAERALNAGQTTESATFVKDNVSLCSERQGPLQRHDVRAQSLYPLQYLTLYIILCNFVTSIFLIF